MGLQCEKRVLYRWHNQFKEEGRGLDRKADGRVQRCETREAVGKGAPGYTHVLLRELREEGRMLRVISPNPKSQCWTGPGVHQPHLHYIWLCYYFDCVTLGTCFLTCYYYCYS